MNGYMPSDDRQREIRLASGKGLTYCAERVIGFTYFDLTPDYAKSLREIASLPEIIDPKFVAAVDIINDVADRIEALAVALKEGRP